MSNSIKIVKPVGRITAAYKLPDPATDSIKNDGFEPLFSDYQDGEAEYAGDGIIPGKDYVEGNDTEREERRKPESGGVRVPGVNRGPGRGDFHTQLETARAEGFEEGRENALSEISARHEAEIEEIRNTMIEFVRNMHLQFDEFRQKSELFVLQFAIAVAEKIIKREVGVNKDLVLTQIKDALHKVLGAEKIKVLVNPQDEKIVKSRRSALLASADSVKEMIVEADDKVDRGGCIIESNHGNVDARLLSQLKNIESALEEKARQNRKTVTRKRKK